jgi:hypothetical protein
MQFSHGLMAAVIASIIFVSANPVQAEPYHNPEYHFHLDIQPGWEVWPKEDLKKSNQLLQESFPGMDMSMVVGFRPVQTSQTRDVFLFVQYDKRVSEKTTFDELEKELTRDYAAFVRGEPEATLRLQRRVILGKPEFDRERERFTVRTGVDHGRSFSVYSVGFLGSGGLIILHGFTRDGKSTAYLPAFNRFSDSFQFDEPEKPKGISSLLTNVFGDQVGPMGRAAIVGGVIAVLVAVMGTLVLRKKPEIKRMF